MNKNFLVNIKASDRPGLLHAITGIFNRKLVPIKSLNAAATDIRDIVLITAEIEVDESVLHPLLAKVENIIEVFAVYAVSVENATGHRLALIKLDRKILDTPQAQVLALHETRIINISATDLVVVKQGSQVEIDCLYAALDGLYLLGLSQSAFINDNPLIEHNEDERISQLAA